MTKLHELHNAGQSVWFDFIRRSFTDSGKLKELIDRGIRGVTSNPSIFEKAIAGSSDYDEEIKKMAVAGKTTKEIYEALVISDIRNAAELLRAVYDNSEGRDGFVSLEVSPTLANDTEATVREAKRLFMIIDRPNVMIKIPATKEGIPAIKKAIAGGVNINVTLIFSVKQYEEAAMAYIEGLEEFIRKGGRPDRISSVASMFVSRVDTAVDKELDKLGHLELKGKIAVDNARIMYAKFLEIFKSGRWNNLAYAGARMQRPLWASTGTKDPDYSDTLYMDSLIALNTVNTVPPNTLEAFLDHGKTEISISNDLEGAHRRKAELAAAGVDLDAITDKLLAEGVLSFTKAYESLLQSVENKRKAVAP